MYTSQTLITAWDETKTIAEWAQNPRATVDDKIILKRYAAGQLAETALGFQKGMDQLRPGVAREYALTVPGPNSRRRAA